MRRREFLIAPLFVTGILEPVARAAPSANAPSSARDTADPRWVQGRVLVPTAPDIAWKRMERVDQWWTLFSDIKAMRVTFKDADEWKLNVETFSFDCGAHGYHVHMTTPRTATIWIDAPGISAIAYLKARETDERNQTRIHYSLFVDMKKPMPWFKTEEELRKKQEKMVERNLLDLERAFAGPRV
jgi:hypothetical protein